MTREVNERLPHLGQWLLITPSASAKTMSGRRRQCRNRWKNDGKFICGSDLPLRRTAYGRVPCQPGSITQCRGTPQHATLGRMTWHHTSHTQSATKPTCRCAKFSSWCSGPRSVTILATTGCNIALMRSTRRRRPTGQMVVTLKRNAHSKEMYTQKKCTLKRKGHIDKLAGNKLNQQLLRKKGCSAATHIQQARQRDAQKK